VQHAAYECKSQKCSCWTPTQTSDGTNHGYVLTAMDEHSGSSSAHRAAHGAVAAHDAAGAGGVGRHINGDGVVLQAALPVQLAEALLQAFSLGLRAKCAHWNSTMQHAASARCFADTGGAFNRGRRAELWGARRLPKRRTIVRSSDAGPQMAATILSSTACDICASACRLQVHTSIRHDTTTPAFQPCRHQKMTALKHIKLIISHRIFARWSVMAESTRSRMIWSTSRPWKPTSVNLVASTYCISTSRMKCIITA
jgi:hypothetical protein